LILIQLPFRNWKPRARAKLQKLIELGVDPWGGRFDDHQAIAAIRAREHEITTDPPPEGKTEGEQHGPRVRAAGRLVLIRDTGKLIFANLKIGPTGFNCSSARSKSARRPGRSRNALTSAT
jgi:lysyl-tRNA synthetase class II